MSDLIKIESASYGRYEELLFTRDNLKKEAFLYEREYIRRFGDLIVSVFQKEIECIGKKKSIEFCRSFLNRGRSVDLVQLQEYLALEMKEFQNQLNAMIEDTENSKKFEEISELDLLAVKRTYRKLVRLIHPDINPLTSSNPDLLDLWNQIQICYKCNNKNGLLELEVQTIAVLKKLNLGITEIEIPDIEVKITELEQEITTIRETDPYQYKFLLENPVSVDEKTHSLEEELHSYEEYSAQLDSILKDLMIDGMNFTWQMN